MPRRVSDGPIRMRALAANLPTALREGFESGRELAPPATGSPAIVAVGMGGSGIAADLARGVIESECPVMLSVVRSSDLPRALDRRSHVILVSYSGDTWETLTAYDAAGRAGVHRTVVCSGGRLAERAADDGVPVLPVPSGMPPRSAVGHLLGGILGLLDPWFPESNEVRVARVADRVRAQIGSYVWARGPAAVLAEKVGERLPFVYAESSFVGLARRWKTQIEENAKRIAVFDEVPELLHNAIVGWDACPRSEAAHYAVLLLEWSGESPATRRSIRYLDRLVTQRGARVMRVPLAAEDRLEALVGGIALGDHMTLALADLRGVDPYPFDAITRVKAALGSPGK
jgi:glucose/mannose-6-phosphate isomerase